MLWDLHLCCRVVKVGGENNAAKYAKNLEDARNLEGVNTYYGHTYLQWKDLFLL